MRFARRPSRVRQALLRPVARAGLARAGEVVLTFDDGPHPEHTPGVLDRLARFGATAAFFLIGRRVAAAPDVAAAVARGGHLVGNHTHTHRRLGWWEYSAAADEIGRCQDVLPGGARWFRPPYGRITPGLIAAARRYDLETVMWTLDSNDWTCRTAADAAACAAGVLDRVRPGDTVLFHDNHEWVGPVLDVVLPGLAARGLLPRRDQVRNDPPISSG